MTVSALSLISTSRQRNLSRVLIRELAARTPPAPYTHAMKGHFGVEVDAKSRVVQVEVGDSTDVPLGILQITARLVTDEIAHSEFTWMPVGSTHSCKVTIRVSKLHGRPEPTALVHGSWSSALPYALTGRELDVTTLIAFGMSSNSIARQLNLSPRTVTTHVDRILKKLETPSRTAAAAMALDQGLIRFPFPGGDNDALSLLKIGRSIRDKTSPRDSGPAFALHPLVIGAAVPLQGLAAADGVEMVRASQLAIEELNDRGGIDGRLIELKIANLDVYGSSNVADAFEELTSRGADIITSGYLARQDIAHEVAADTEIPYLHAATLDVMAKRVEEDPGRYGRIFQVCASDLNYAPKFVEMLTHLRTQQLWNPSSRRLTVIQGAWDQTNLGLEEAAKLAELNQWSLDIIQPGTEPDAWAKVAELIRMREPAGVLLGNYLVEDTTSFLDAFLTNPSRTLLYSLYAPSVPEFREHMGKRADGLLWSTVTGTYSDPHARSFVNRYKWRYGENPGRSHAGIAYDRVGLIARAWASASNPRDSAAVSRELRNLIHRGVNGVYYFGGPSQAALSYPAESADPSLAQAHLIFQIQDGRQKIIDPDPYADGGFVTPWWLTP